MGMDHHVMGGTEKCVQTQIHLLLKITTTKKLAVSVITPSFCVLIQTCLKLIKIKMKGP